MLLMANSASLWSLLVGCLLAAAPLHHLAKGSTVGVNYGRDANNLPSPDQVVSFLKSKNVGKVRIFDADNGVLRAFDNSGISLIVGVRNEQLQGIASSQTAANQWVQNNIVPYSSTINYIAVGNEVLINNQQYAQYLLPAMQNVYRALGSFNLQGRIKVSTTHSTGVLDSKSFPPSKGNFQSQIKAQMSAILEFHSQTGSAFLASVYPFFAYIGANGQIDRDYALFGPAQGVDDPGTGLHYGNLFDAQLDTLIAAMDALGHGGVPIIVTETGWPWKGHSAATVENARMYNNNLVKHVPDGTPKRRGGMVETYVFALFNENLKMGPEYERSWGLFYPDQSKVYDVIL